MNGRSVRTSLELWHGRSAWKNESDARESVMSGKGITREADLLHRDTVGITALRKGDHAQDPGVHTIGTNLPRFLVTLSLYYVIRFKYDFHSSHCVHSMYWTMWTLRGCFIEDTCHFHVLKTAIFLGRTLPHSLPVLSQWQVLYKVYIL